MNDRIARVSSPLGSIILASDGEALTGLCFDGQQPLSTALSAAREAPSLPVFALAARWLDAYFAGGEPDFTPPLCLRGTAFQRAVWELLLEIPYGQTLSYGALAQRLAARQGLARISAQAIGGAAGRNPIALIVPCHRVVAADGSLRGYAAGLERKRRLLALEACGDRRQAAEQHPAML